MDPFIAAGVALITGSGSGIGQQIAVAFAKTGCEKIFLADISEPGLEQTRSLVSKVSRQAKVILHKVDVTNDASVEGMVKKCVEEFGRIDFACNNAGIAMSNVRSVDISIDTFDKVHDVNLKGIYLCHKYEIAAMVKQELLPAPGLRYLPRGSIVNTASMAGLSAIGGLSAYNSSKHGVVTMTRVDARQFAKDGIRINCVCPGFVDTPLFRGSGLTHEYIASAEDQSPMKRLIDPAEIAGAVVFLSGASASAITGISMPVDGGALLYHII